MRVQDKQLEDFILSSGLSNEKELNELKKSLKDKKQSFSQALVANGILTSDDLRRAEAYVHGVSFVDLKNRAIDLSTFALIPEPISRNHNLIAFKRGEKTLEVALLDLGDLSHLDFVKQEMGLKVFPHLTDEESMKWALLSYQKLLKAEFGDVIQKEASRHAEYKDWTPEDKSLSRMVEALLKHAIIQGALDVYIEPQETQTLIRYRLGSALRDAMILPKSASQGIVLRLKNLSNLKLEVSDRPQHGGFAVETNGENFSFRLSTLPTSWGEMASLRLLGEGASGFTLESLGLPQEALDELHKALHLKEGMILVAGEEGSGKTTTLYTLLDLVNKPHLSLATIENPVEYRLNRVNHVQVNPEVGLTFSQGLRSLLRQSPDVVLVGELGDLETAQLALGGAYAGPLVLSAVKAPSAIEAINYLKKLGVDSGLLASSLKLVLAQRLVKTSQGGYRGEYELLKITPEVRNSILADTLI